MITVNKKQARLFAQIAAKENFSNLINKTCKALTVELQQLNNDSLSQLGWAVFTGNEELNMLELFFNIRTALQEKRLSDSKRNNLKDLESMYRSVILYTLTEDCYKEEVLKNLMLLKLSGVAK